MKIFLFWGGKDSKETINSVLKLKGQSNRIVYWMGGNSKHKDKLPETIFHTNLDVLHGIPAKGIDISEFPPPGKDLIKRLHKVESLILTMMNAKLDELCTDERKHLYYNMLQYWHGVFKKYKPDIIIHSNVPHDTCSYLIYELAHLLNIKTIMFQDTYISDRLLAYIDFWKGSDDLHKELQKNQNKNFSLKDLSKDLQEYYKMQTDSKRDATPVYIDILKNKYSRFGLLLDKLRNFKKSIKQGTVLKKIAQSIVKKFKQNLKKEYNSIQIKPDFNKKFIYVPLHLQPELSTSPQGHIFADQILMLEILSASLPSDWIIYAKEHPFQWIRRGLIFSSARYQGYYKKIAKLKNVKIIPIKTDTYTLINKTQAVATASGTAGWEAILRSKPALIFGYPWYRDCSEIFRIKDVESCKKALEKITNGFVINQQQIINYLKCLDKATIHAYISPEIGKQSKLTEKESINSRIQRIISEIKKK